MESIPSNRRVLPLRQRHDLETSEIVSGSESLHVVKDPLALEYYHLRPEQFAVWSLLDGTRGVDEIRSLVLKRYPMIVLRNSDVLNLIADLHQKGLTTTPRSGQAERLERRRLDQLRKKWIGALTNPFFIKLPSVKSDRATQLANMVLGWMFTPWGCLFACTVLFASWFEAAIRFDALRGALPSLETFFGWPNLNWLWLMIGISKILHEFGHAVACQRVGRRCHGIGAGLLVFSPTLYCEASDSWMCKNKWDRILVASAGMYVELILGAVALFVWSHTYPGLLHSLALNLAVITTVSTVIFNANPLIRFDGYYILSDFLEIPNLQQKSSKLFYRWAAWCLGIELEPESQPQKTGRGWFVAYAAAAFFYRWFIFAVILASVYSFLRPNRIESLGVVFAIAIIVMSAAGIGRSWKSVSSSRRQPGLARTRLITTLGLFVMAALLVFFVPFSWHTRIPVQAQVRDPMALYARTDARITGIHADHQQFVQKGQLLISLDNPELDDEVRILRRKLELLRTEIESLSLRNQHSELVLRRQELERTERRNRELAALLSSMHVRAPVDGYFLHGPFRPHTQSERELSAWEGWPLSKRNQGATVQAGAELATIVRDPTKLVAVCYVDQHAREMISEGLGIQIRWDCFPHATFEGEIEKISPSGRDSVPSELGQRLGGRISTIPSGDDREVASTTFYQVIAKTTQVDWLMPRMRGQARFADKPQTLSRRLYRWWRSTFYFRW